MEKTEFIEKMRLQDEKIWELVLKLKEQNEQVKEKCKNFPFLVNYYSCQKCQSEIITMEENIKITFKEFPICGICSKEIK